MKNFEEKEKERISEVNIKAYNLILNSNSPDILRARDNEWVYPAKGKENWIAPKPYKAKV